MKDCHIERRRINSRRSETQAHSTPKPLVHHVVLRLSLRLSYKWIVIDFCVTTEVVVETTTEVLTNDAEHAFGNTTSERNSNAVTVGSARTQDENVTSEMINRRYDLIIVSYNSTRDTLYTSYFMASHI